MPASPEPLSDEVKALMDEQGVDFEASGLKYLTNDARVNLSNLHLRHSVAAASVHHSTRPAIAFLDVLCSVSSSCMQLKGLDPGDRACGGRHMQHVMLRWRVCS